MMKFNGTNWENVGKAGFSASDANFTSLALDSSGTPYVAYAEVFGLYKATVMKFNGTTWETVGTAGFSAGQAQYTSLALDTSGTPYVAYADGEKSGKATVMKFNGTSWDPVGTAGFSAGGAEYISLVLDSSDTPYVVYADIFATVMKFNGTNWETVGTAGFSAGQAQYTSLALDTSGTPYVAYRDGGNSFKATVMKFNGTNWELVGEAGFSAGGVNYTSLALDSSGKPFVAYKDGNSGKATVRDYVVLDLIATKSNNTGGNASTWTAFNWSVTISNTGDGTAVFGDGENIIMDELPVEPSYDAPTAQNFTNITGIDNIDCYITKRSGERILNCDAYGGDVTIASGGSFNVVFDVTPTITGVLINPAGGGICKVDPDGLVLETDEGNNNCIPDPDTVNVTEGAGSTSPGSGDGDTGIKIGTAGGVFTYGPVKLIFPQLSLYVLPVAVPSGGDNIRLGSDGRVFDIIVRDYRGNIVSEFDFPLIVCIKPSAAELSAAGGNPHLINIFHKHGGKDWQVLDTFVDDGYICTTVNRLSLFGLGIPLMPSTGFTPDMVTTIDEQPAEKSYASMGDLHLEIPALDLEVPIVGVPLSLNGWDVSWLDDQVGYLEGTAYPTWAGNTAITAHVWDADNNPGPFVDLHNLRHGDEVIIHAWGQKHIYEVREVTEYRPDDISAFPHEDYDVLTLVTCQGFDESSGKYRWRLAVRAVLVKVE
ncbi:MAG: sortase [Anaerolineales bacterium]|nr:sortase [FCB group bacterium]MBL6982181.1 sortase [Anaerolineales bacterium]